MYCSELGVKSLRVESVKALEDVCERTDSSTFTTLNLKSLADACFAMVKLLEDVGERGQWPQGLNGAKVLRIQCL